MLFATLLFSTAWTEKGGAKHIFKQKGIDDKIDLLNFFLYPRPFLVPSQDLQQRQL